MNIAYSSIFIAFLSLFYTNKYDVDCLEFYEKSDFKNLVVDGKLNKKIKGEEEYILLVEGVDGDFKELRLFINKTSNSIFRLIEVGDIVKKDKNTYMTRIAHYEKNKNLSVKVFEHLCD